MPACVEETCDIRTLASVAAAPLNVSFASTLRTAVPPLRGAAPASSTASIGNGFTVIDTSAVSQLVGLAISQIRYVSVCGPGGVPTGTHSAPFQVLSMIPGLVVDTVVTVTRADVTGVPSSVSFAKTLIITSPLASVVTLSFTASMTNGRRTLTLTVASSQFDGDAVSQMR